MTWPSCRTSSAVWPPAAIRQPFRGAGYQMVMKRCAADSPEHVPGIRWFIYPLGYAEATRAATPPEKRRQGKTSS